MNFVRDRVTKAGRFGAAATFAVSLSACSIMPSWLGGSDNTPSYPADTGPSASNTAQTPDLANIPSRPPAQSSDATAQVTQSLESDRTRASYSAEALHAENAEVVAPPPAAVLSQAPPLPPAATPVAAPATAQDNPSSAPSTTSAADSGAALPASSDSGSSGTTEPGTEASVVEMPESKANTPPPAPRPTFDSPVAPVAKQATTTHTTLAGKAAMPGILPPPDADAVSTPAANTASATFGAPPQSTNAEPSPPAIAQQSTNPPIQAASEAPPVPTPAPMQTAMAESPRSQPVAAPTPPPASASSPSSQDAALGFKPSSAPPLDPSVSKYVPGSVVARYQQTAPASTAPTMAPAAPGTNARAATIAFANDGTTLDAASREQVRAAAELFKTHGGAGYVRIVGHASGAGANPPTEKQLEANFAQSQARANAVAQAMIAAGVPAARILVETAGPAQDANAEIFFQG